MKKNEFNNKDKNITIISNILFIPSIDTCIKKYLAKNLGVFSVSYIRYEDYDVNLAEKIKESDIVMVCINFEEMFPDAPIDVRSKKISVSELKNYICNRFSTLYEKIKKKSHALVIWVGMEDYSYKFNKVIGNVCLMESLVDCINVFVTGMLRATDVFIDLKRLIANIGCNNAYNDVGKYRWGAPYSNLLIDEIAREICKQYLIYRGVIKKCVVLDCDNVLWGGILAEDGIDHILLGNELGRDYQDFQRFILYLYYCGAILCVCSKNDINDVKKVFYEHKGMILKEEYISSFQVGWGSKVKGIVQISKELNIGLDSIVFIDDSYNEIAEVSALLPEVECILFKKNSVYDNFNFNLPNYIDINEVYKRHKTYTTNVYRKKLEKTCSTHDDFLSALDTRLYFSTAKTIDIARISELSLRTNKCTIGMRYGIDELEFLNSLDNYHLYIVSAVDCFSDLGVVGAIGMENETLKLFALSCRALGRNIEDEMIEYIKNMGGEDFYFVSTNKNDFLLALLKKSGMKQKKDL